MLSAVGDGEHDVSVDAVNVVAADWHHVLNGQRVVDVDDGTDLWQAFRLDDAATEGFYGATVLIWLKAERTVRFAPIVDRWMFGQLLGRWARHHQLFFHLTHRSDDVFGRFRRIVDIPPHYKAELHGRKQLDDRRMNL